MSYAQEIPHFKVASAGLCGFNRTVFLNANRIAELPEHGPHDELVALGVLVHGADAEAQIVVAVGRLLRPGGAFSCRIDLQDHYSYFDRSLSRYNFLRYSEPTWALVNSPLHYQNRLRAPDYLRLVREAGLNIVVERPSRPSDEGRAELEAMSLAKRFCGYSVEDVGVTILSFVARAPD